MSVIIERAKELANELSCNGVRATADITRAGTITPGILVVPVPTMTPTTLAGNAIEVEWQIVCLAKQPANLNASKDLIDLATHAWTFLEEAITFTPDAYQITNEISLPALVGSFEEVLIF